MRKRPSKAERLQDRRIEAAYGRGCAGIQINIMDIGKVFAAAREAMAEQELNDQELQNVIRNFVEIIRKN